MKISSFFYKGETYLIKQIPRKEMQSILDLPLLQRCQKLFSLSINKKLDLNTHNGSIKDITYLMNTITKKGVI